MFFICICGPGMNYPALSQRLLLLANECIKSVSQVGLCAQLQGTVPILTTEVRLWHPVLTMVTNTMFTQDAMLLTLPPIQSPACIHQVILLFCSYLYAIPILYHFENILWTNIHTLCLKTFRSLMDVAPHLAWPLPAPPPSLLTLLWLLLLLLITPGRSRPLPYMVTI